MALLTYFRQLRVYIEGEPWLHLLVTTVIMVLAAVAGHFFVKFGLRRVGRAVGPRLGTVASEFARDDVLFGRLSLFVPTLIIYQCVEMLPGISGLLPRLVQKTAVMAAIVIGLGAVTRVLFKGNEIYTRYPVSRTRPIKGYLQVISIVLYALGFIVIIATALDKSPLVFVSGLGAMTAVILLVFRDTLLSLVAGVQLTTNDLIRVGDWIEMPQFGADGDVVDIALHVVKVQNWDKTITVIPTHKFLEHSFKNWRGMSEAGGRRIKRAIHIDLNSIRFLEEEELDHFERFALLKDYIGTKRAELAEHNRNRDIGDAVISNARRLTNVGTFRAYVQNYLRLRPEIHQGMTFLVRQLQPTSEGLPLEIYVFCRDTRWAYYEAIQADLFDHIFAVVPHFDLRLYQFPSGRDLKGLGALAPGAAPVETVPLRN